MSRQYSTSNLCNRIGEKTRYEIELNRRITGDRTDEENVEFECM